MNIEATIIEYLNKNGIKAVADIPATRPDEFVTVERTGGSFGSVVLDRPTVAVQAWSTTRYKASELMTEVDTLMRNLVSISGVSKCSRNSLYNYPDESGHPRYQAVYDIVTY